LPDTEAKFIILIKIITKIIVQTMICLILKQNSSS
jgi:hypothetical protein